MQRKFFLQRFLFMALIVCLFIFVQLPFTHYHLQSLTWAGNSGWSDGFGNSQSKNSRAVTSDRGISGNGWNSVVESERSVHNRGDSFIRDFHPATNPWEKPVNLNQTKIKTPKAVTKTQIATTAKLKPETRKVPAVKFSATDPCAALATNDSGLPWETESSENKIDLPEDVDVALPPAIEDLKNLSNVSYNSAVSIAFEGMRLIYGPLSKSDAQKFEANWAPIFDFPTQEIIDYLNKLNPLLSQFLAGREAFLRNLNDIQMVLFDAAFAIEMDDQQAWEEAMAEAGMYASAITPLETALKIFAKKIEGLGNPPDPNAAKCKQRRRYKKALQSSSAYPFAGEWEDSNGKRSLLKVAYNYKDGKLLVYNYPISWFEEMKTAGFKINKLGQLQSVDGKLAMMPGVYDLLQVFEQIEPDVWVSLNWSMIKAVFIYRTQGEEMEISNYQPQSGLNKTTTRKRYTVYKVDESYRKPPVLRFDGEAKTWDDLLLVVPLDMWSGNKYRHYMNWRQESPAEVAIALNITVDDDNNNSTAENDTPDNKPPSNPLTTTEDNESKISQSEQDKKDAIDTHTEMVKVIKHDLDREISERDEVVKALAQAKTRQEATEHNKRLKQLNLRIIGLQSNMQAEQDLVASYETGKLVHTRQIFDEYARTTLIDNMRKKAADIDGTRRIAARIDRQIELLPWEVQAKARKLARKILDSKTIASGDLAKARTLVKTFNQEIQGYAEYDHALAVEAEVDANENEVLADLGIMAVGMGCIGFGSAALANAYGAEAAVSIYAPNILGAVYGGTTGFVRGGPKEGLTQAVSWCSPKGFAAMQFFEGYENAGYQENASTATKVWAGVQQAGTAYAIGKTIEFGAGLITKGSLVCYEKVTRRFKPVTKLPSKRAAEIVDGMLTDQNFIDAEVAIKATHKIEVKLAFLKRNSVQNVQKIAALENELQQMAASLNASYYSKWLLKYKIPPGIRRRVNLRIQKNYEKITPAINAQMEAKGYNMQEIEFKQFRNSSSAGSSSMDLDWGPVLKKTGQEPGIKMFTKKMVLKKDGTMVSLETFMNDSQTALNIEYYKEFGMSAPMSDMNMVTSVHPEAFSTPKLLEKNIDFSTLDAKDIESVGKVLKVKMDGITKNKMLTKITKMQARCRESAKEIDNMLLKKLRQNLQKAPAKSPQQKQIQADICYWEDMLKRFRKIGTEETNPLEIIRLNREIMHETGGKDITGVINDLMHKFNPKLEPIKG